MATNTATSFTNHTAPSSGSTAGPYPISFNYLEQSDVDVTVDGVLQTLSVAYTFTSGTQITFTSGNEPANGAAIVIKRDTNISAKKVDFQDGSVLTETDLDTNTEQLLFGLQEFTDKINGIEDLSTRDMDASEIRAAVEAATDSNVFTDADHAKLDSLSNVNDAILNSDLDGKGELLVGDGSGNPTALPVGTDGYVLKADSNEPTGVKWSLASTATPIGGSVAVNSDYDFNDNDIDGLNTLNVRLIKFIGAAQAGSPTGIGPRLFNTTSGTLQLAFPYNGGANYSTTISFSGPSGETHFFSPLRISDTVDVKTIANTYPSSGIGYVGFYVQVDTKTQQNRYGGSTGSTQSFQFKDYKARGLNTQNNPTKLGEWKDAPAFHAVPGVKYRFDQTDSSNLTYTLGFFTDEARTTPYTTGVTTVGSAGNSDPAYTEITFTESTPQILYYGATNTLASFDYMGNIVITNTGITGASSGGGTTNLSNTANGTSLTIESSSGNNTSLPAATTSAWGVMTDNDKTTLDSAILDGDFTSNGFMKRTGAGSYTVDTNTYLTAVPSGYLQNVSEDSSPQLGANLDIQTNEITTSTSDGNIVLNPNGTGVVEVKGDGTTSGTVGTLQLNCSNNNHGVKIASPPHSAGASYTLTLPNTDGSANQVLKTDGSGGLDWVDQPTANATHTGEVTGSTTLTIADDVIDEANLKVSNSPTNGYVLTAQSGNTGGLTWAAAASGLVGSSNEKLFVEAENQMDNSFTTTANFNYVAASPMTIATGAVLTVSANSTMTFI